MGVDTYRIDNRYYAIVAGSGNDGVQVVDTANAPAPVGAAYAYGRDIPGLAHHYGVVSYSKGDSQFALVASGASDSGAVSGATDAGISNVPARTKYCERILASDTTFRSPVSFSGTASDKSYPPNVKITNYTLPVATGGTGIEYTLTPALPAGPALDGRATHGTLTAAKSGTEYTYTATNDDSSAKSLSFNITVWDKQNAPEVAVTPFTPTRLSIEYTWPDTQCPMERDGAGYDIQYKDASLTNWVTWGSAADNTYTVGSFRFNNTSSTQPFLQNNCSVRQHRRLRARYSGLAIRVIH